MMEGQMNLLEQARIQFRVGDGLMDHRYLSFQAIHSQMFKNGRNLIKVFDAVFN